MNVLLDLVAMDSQSIAYCTSLMRGLCSSCTYYTLLTVPQFDPVILDFTQIDDVKMVSYS